MHTHQNGDSTLNSESCIWGVEITKDYTAVDVRDAMVTCFVNANGDMIAQISGKELPEDEHKKHEMLEELTKGFVRQAFEQTGGNFDEPTKESITKALEMLKAFAKKANHDDAMIERHASDISKLTEGIKG